MFVFKDKYLFYIIRYGIVNTDGRVIQIRYARVDADKTVFPLVYTVI
jgi:hypothetical protein